jgi:hypothetical protein
MAVKWQSLTAKKCPFYEEKSLVRLTLGFELGISLSAIPGSNF